MMLEISTSDDVFTTHSIFLILGDHSRYIWFWLRTSKSITLVKTRNQSIGFNNAPDNIDREEEEKSRIVFVFERKIACRRDKGFTYTVTLSYLIEWNLRCYSAFER